MRGIPQYHFYRTKYGDELLVDVVELHSIQKYIQRDPVHRLSYYDITLITEGSGEYIVNNYSYQVEPGDILCTIPGEVRGWKNSKHVNGYALIFEEEFLLSFFNDPHFIKNLTYFNAEKVSFRLHPEKELNKRILQLFHQIKSEIKHAAKDHHILRAMLYEVLVLLNRAYTIKTQQNDDRGNNQPSLNHKGINRHLHTFTQLVDDNFITHRSMAYYADKLCITPNYLNEIVRENLGVSAKVYIQQKVMHEAKSLLNYTTLSITEIADTLNYTTTSYFIRTFHKHTGLTPGQYRDNQNVEK